MSKVNFFFMQASQLLNENESTKQAPAANSDSPSNSLNQFDQVISMAYVLFPGIILRLLFSPKMKALANLPRLLFGTALTLALVYIIAFILYMLQKLRFEHADPIMGISLLGSGALAAEDISPKLVQQFTFAFLLAYLLSWWSPFSLDLLENRFAFLRSLLQSRYRLISLLRMLFANVFLLGQWQTESTNR